ncbi:MAG: ThuA domain-containing protein [Candidatus Poribacteria bacterium]|nr:ThuA domain-containing protein [Candidatus Poribacteria bacterium]
MSPIRALCWSERTEPLSVYPDGIDGAVADALKEIGVEVKTAKMDDPEHGLSEEVLAETDVLFWWSHIRNGDLSEDVNARVVKHVLARGMGFVPIHSALFAKPFQTILGCTGNIGGWDHNQAPENVYVIDQNHPIAEGLGAKFVLPETEMYVEPFDVPPPDELIFISSFSRGEVFRSGMTWYRGRGRIFYFRPGHETYKVLFEEPCRKVFQNAARWGASRA